MKKIIMLIILLTISVSFVGCSASEKYKIGVDTALKKGDPIVINSLRIIEINSVGGVTVGFHYTNTSDKTIKYLKADVVTYNAVGDEVKGSISGINGRILSDTGPVFPLKNGGGTWKNIIYNGTVKRLEIIEIKIEYMDGTELIINGYDKINKLTQKYYNNL